MEKKIRAIAYFRKSTDGRDVNGQTRQEGSFDRQKKAVLEFAQRNNLVIVDMREEAESGKSVRKRDVFLEIVEMAKNPNRIFDAIIFDDPSRFMRNVRLAREYEEIFRRFKLRVYFLNAQNDGSFGDRLTMSMLCELAEMYSRDLARKCLGGITRKAEQRSWLGGVPPYGYRSARGQDNIVRLIIQEDEAEVVREIFKLSLQGVGHKKIALTLNDRGILAGYAARFRKGKNRNPDGKWSGGGIRVILSNPAYIGRYRWNKLGYADSFKWSYDRQKKGGVAVGDLNSDRDEFRKDKVVNLTLGALPNVFGHRVKPKEEWFEEDNIFPAIVDREIFDQVQERFRKLPGRKWLRSNTIRFLMSGKLRCGTCNNNWHAHRYKTELSTGQRAHYEYYKCSGDIRKGSHGRSARPMVRRAAVDEVVMNGLSERIKAVCDPAAVGEMFRAMIQTDFETQGDQLQLLEKRLKKNGDEMNRMMEAFIKHNYPVDEVRMRELKTENKQLEAECTNLKAAGGPPKFDLGHEVQEAMGRLGNMKEILEKDDKGAMADLRDTFLQMAEMKWLEGEDRPKLELEWREIPGFFLEKLRSTSI